MSLLNNNKNKKGGKKNPKANTQGSKFIAKPSGKTSSFAQKTQRTGGSRGS